MSSRIENDWNFFSNRAKIYLETPSVYRASEFECLRGQLMKAGISRFSELKRNNEDCTSFRDNELLPLVKRVEAQYKAA